MAMINPPLQEHTVAGCKDPAIRGVCIGMHLQQQHATLSSDWTSTHQASLFCPLPIFSMWPALSAKNGVGTKHPKLTCSTLTYMARGCRHSGIRLLQQQGYDKGMIAGSHRNAPLHRGMHTHKTDRSLVCSNAITLGM